MQSIAKSAVPPRPPSACGILPAMPSLIASALSRIMLSSVRDPGQWLHLVARTITDADDDSAASSTPICAVARAAIVVSDAESPSWKVQAVGSSGGNPGPAIGAAGGATVPLDAEGLAAVPASVPAQQGCATRRQVIPDAQWPDHGIRAARTQLGLDEFARIALAIVGSVKSQRLIIQLDQRLGAPWPEHEICEFLSILGPHLVQAYVTQVMQPRARRQSLLERVSPVQRLIVSMLVEGKTERDIAKVLSRSPHTIHDHVKTIYAVLGISSRFELIDKWSGGAVTGELNHAPALAHSA